MPVELVQTTTRDGVRLDGALQLPPLGAARHPHVDAFCLVHGTGGNFYGSSLFDQLAERLIALGCAVLRVNTRGHDIISNAVTARGGRRLGAAYELVDDCRHDLTAWAVWLRQRVGARVGVVGHSLGAVKCLYALAHEPQLGATCALAISPPRLAYGWFCAGPERGPFLETFARAEQLVAAGQPLALLEVQLPLPMVITAAGYVEKYGPDERYDYFKFIAGVRCPLLLTLGSVEADNNMAFRGAAAGLSGLDRRPPLLSVVTIAGADHFYTATRTAFLDQVESWLVALATARR